MYKGGLKQPQKLIPFESKYRDKRFGHVPQGIINPLPTYKDPRKPLPEVEITIDSSKVVLKPPPIEMALKTKAYIKEDLKTPFIYIKQLKKKEQKREQKSNEKPDSTEDEPKAKIKKTTEKKEFWNHSGNVSSLRVDKAVNKKDITDIMALSIPEINEDIANFLKGFLKNLHRLLSMKLYFDISHTSLDFPQLFQGFCKIKKLKKEKMDDMLVNEKQFVEFFKMLGWEKANFPLEDLESFFQLAKLDDKNIYFQKEMVENLRKSLDLRPKSQGNRQKSYDSDKETNKPPALKRAKGLKESDVAAKIDENGKPPSFKRGNNLRESDLLDEDKKKTAVAKKNEPQLSIKALMYNYEKFLQEKARIKSLTSSQSSFGRAEILRNLLNDFEKNYKDSKIMMKLTLYARTGFLLLKNMSDIPYVIKYDKLRGFYEDLAFEKATVMKFLKGKHFPDDMHPEVLTKSLEELQKKKEEELKVMGDFVQEFKKEKQHFKETNFTLLELVDFIYERKYSRKDFDILTKLIKKVKRMYNYSQNHMPDEEIKPKHHLDLSFLSQSLNGICHKVYLMSEILSCFIENLNCLVLKNIEHYKPKNPEIHRALLHNLALDFAIKYIGNLSQKIERISHNLENVHNQIEQTSELLAFLEDITYRPEPANFRESLSGTTPTALQNSGGLSFGPGLFQKAKNNNKQQRIMKILADNFLELNEEFTLGIQLPTPNQAVNKLKPQGGQFLQPDSPQITTVTDEDENNYFSNIKRPIGEKQSNLDYLSPKDILGEDRDEKLRPGLKKKNMQVTDDKGMKIKPKIGFTSPQKEHGDEDDVIDILNSKKPEELLKNQGKISQNDINSNRNLREIGRNPEKRADYDNDYSNRNLRDMGRNQDKRFDYDQDNRINLRGNEDFNKNERNFNFDQNNKNLLKQDNFGKNNRVNEYDQSNRNLYDNEEINRGRNDDDNENKISNEEGWKFKKSQPISAKKEKTMKMKIIKKNFIEIPELLDPYALKHPLELKKVSPYVETMSFAEFDIGPPKEKLETEDDNLKVLSPDQLDFRSTTKSFVIGEKEKADPSKKKDSLGQTKKTQFLDQAKKTNDKMTQLDRWMESNIPKKEEKKKDTLIKPEDNEDLNLSQILMQAKQKKDTTVHERSPDRPGANRLEDTLNQSYYKPEAVEIGKYAVKSDLFREYELYLPVDYYTKLTKKDEKEKDQWYVRPHHIETVTEHPLSYKDNILDTKYQSWLEPMEKQLNPTEFKEKDRKEKKEELISNMENRLRKLQEELDLKKASQMFPKNSSFMESHGIKTMENYFDSVRDHKNTQLMTSSYETMLHELRKEEKDILNKKRGEFSTDVGVPEERWWEKKGKEFARELKKYDLLNYKAPSGHSDFVNKLQIKELY